MTKAVSHTLTRRRFLEDSCAAALLLGGATAAVSEAAEQARRATNAPAADWGPLAGPWKRYEGNPVMKIGDFNQSYSIQNGPQTVVRKDGRWYMLVMTATSYDTRLAVSDDGFRWRPSGHGPVIRPDKPWEGRYALTKAVVPFNDGFRAYYFNKRGRIEDICTASSEDLIHWEKHPGPIFTAKDAKADGERVFPGSAVQYEGKWYLFYDIAWDYGWRGIGPPPAPATRKAPGKSTPAIRSSRRPAIRAIGTAACCNTFVRSGSTAGGCSITMAVLLQWLELERGRQEPGRGRVRYRHRDPRGVIVAQRRDGGSKAR